MTLLFGKQERLVGIAPTISYRSYT